MQTRIINTKIYRDKQFRKLSHKDKFLTIYLLTNEFLEALPVIEIELEVLAFHACVSEKELQSLLDKSEHFQIFYKDGFLIIGDQFTYANYKGGKTYSKKNLMYEALPDSIKECVDIEGNIAQSLPNHCSIIEHINHKTKTINHKPKNINHKTEFEILEKSDMELKEILDFYNSIFDRKTTSTKAFESNYQDWRLVHPVEKIKEAINNAFYDAYWRDKFDLEILFRKKNPRNENVDYIEKFASKPPQQTGGSLRIL